MLTSKSLLLSFQNIQDQVNMKFNRIPAIAATLALTILGAMAISTTALAASPAPAVKTSAVDNQPVVIPEKLKLTADQNKKIIAIRAEGKSQIVAELTPAQRVKYAAGMKANKKLSTVLNSLNLSAAQKTKIQGIIKKSNDQIKATLTAEQLKYLQGMKK